MAHKILHVHADPIAPALFGRHDNHATVAHRKGQIIMTRLTVVALGLAGLFSAACGSSSPTAPTSSSTPTAAITIPCDIVGTLPCQIPPPPTPAPAPPAATSFTVSGTVTDGTSGGVLPGILITLNSGSKTTVTNAAGRYSVPGVPIGPLTVTATATSYLKATATATVTADTTVDLVLQREPSAPPVPPTAPLPPTHPGLTYDTITAPHEFIIGTPTPTANQASTYCCWPIPVRNAGSYTYDISNFPLDNLPSGGASNTISASEMLIVGIHYGQPATQPTTMTWHRAIILDDTIFAYRSPAADGVYSFIGHFSWEITVPGSYYVVIENEWGSARIDYAITGPSATGTRTLTVPGFASPKGGIIRR